ncbi:MAG: ATP-binding protein [Armatimonadetes bacterium]|nr:ATP-binding protein [Armatimonadota bacterium]
MYERGVTQRLLAALSDTPVVLLHGPRQAGKTTLAQHLASGAHPATYLTLDTPAVLAAAKGDPAGFVARLQGPTVIDEIQRAPELFMSIKEAVDRHRRPGRFLVTGSANVLLLPRLAEFLAGRMAVLTLHPLAQCEIEGRGGKMVDWLFASAPPSVATVATTREDVVRRIVAGGYPEPLAREPARRDEWFGAYVTTILSRDVRDIAQRIERLAELPRILALLASRTGALLNVADIARTVGIPYTTLRSYLSVLQTTFLIHLIPAWTANVRHRLVKAPRLVTIDTGLAAYLGGADAARVASEPDLLGALLETFVITELLKQAGWSRTLPVAYHYRTDAGEEVDLVFEDRTGRVVGIEVKSAVSVGPGDFRGLRGLQRDAGKKFHRGVLFYLGETTVPFGENLSAVPVGALWHDLNQETAARRKS